MIDQPRIAVTFQADGDLLLTSALKLSDEFAVHILDASDALKSSIHAWINSYLSRKPIPAPSLPEGTPFQTKVWEALAKTQFGTTLSYQDVARKIGNPKAARAVGSACNRNPLPLIVPCHRVIHADKSIGGFAIDLEIKKRLLEFESGS